MSNLEQKHQQQLLGSAIDQSIIDLNFESLDGEGAADALLYSPNIKRKNDGCVTASFQKYQSLGDGWWCAGVDISTGELMSWGCFRPDQPRIDAKEDKEIKYEHPPKVETEYFAFRVTFAIGQKIAQRYGLEAQYTEYQGEQSLEAEDSGFWLWAITQKSIPLLITEGAKKAACLLSHGFLAIGLPGVWMGCIPGTDTLKPGIARVSEGRETVPVFDMDDKPKTIENVNNAAVKLAKALLADGATKVTRCEWSSRWKGVDDLIAKHVEGLEEFEYQLERRKEVDVSSKKDSQSSSEDNPCSVCKGTDGECFIPENGKSATCTHKGKGDEVDGWVYKKQSADNRSVFYPVKPAGSKKPRAGESKFKTSINAGLQIFKKASDEAGEGEWVKIGDHITAVAESDSVEGGERALVLEFCDQESEVKTTTFDKGYFFEDGSASLKALARQNYKLTNRKNRENLLDYLYSLGQGLPVIRLSPTTGWHGQTYVGAIKSYGTEDIRWKDITPPKGENLPVIIGTHRGWVDGVAKPSHGNSRAMIAIGMGLAGCLIRLLGMESGGIHFWGGSGDGKTTIGKIVGSTTGQSKLRQWRSTPNGMEAVFRSANDNLMAMDELSKDMGRYMSEIIYMMNGQGKNRMKRDQSLAGSGEWALLLFSTGEISSIDLMESAGEAVKAGQEVRFTDVPAAPAGGFGCFETVHGQDPAVFTLGIERACAANSGVALDMFIAQLQKTIATNEDWCSDKRAIVEEIATNLTGDSKTPAIRRIARRFAVIKVALDLACEWGILPWVVDDNLWAVNKLFGEWIKKRGGGSIEINKAIEKIKYLLTTTEFSERWYRAYDKSRDPGQKVRDLLGYRKVAESDATEEFWITNK